MAYPVQVPWFSKNVGTGFHLINGDQLKEICDPNTPYARLVEIVEHVREKAIPVTAETFHARDREGKQVWVEGLSYPPPGISTVIDVSLECWYAALRKAREFTECESKYPKWKVNKDGSHEFTYRIKVPRTSSYLDQLRDE